MFLAQFQTFPVSGHLIPRDSACKQKVKRHQVEAGVACLLSRHLSRRNYNWTLVRLRLSGRRNSAEPLYMRRLSVLYRYHYYGQHLKLTQVRSQLFSPNLHGRAF